MYDPTYTDAPRDKDHLWEMIERNVESARHVLEDYHLESRDEAIAGEFRPRAVGAGGKTGKRSKAGPHVLRPMNILAYRQVDEDYDQRDYCYELGRETLPQVQEMIDARELTPAFFQAWAVLQSATAISPHMSSTRQTPSTMSERACWEEKTTRNAGSLIYLTSS